MKSGDSFSLSLYISCVFFGSYVWTWLMTHTKDVQPQHSSCKLAESKLQ